LTGDAGIGTCFAFVAGAVGEEVSAGTSR